MQRPGNDARIGACDALLDGKEVSGSHGAQVVLHPAFGAPGAGVLAWTWVCVACASAGLALLYKTTVADPGFLPLGPQPRNGADKVPAVLAVICLQ